MVAKMAGLGDLLSVVAAGPGWLAAQAIAGNATVTDGGTVAVITGGEVGLAVGAVLPPGSGKGGHGQEGGQEGGLGGTCHGVGRGGVRGSGGAQAARVLAAWEGRRVWGRPSSLVSVERDGEWAAVLCTHGRGVFYAYSIERDDRRGMVGEKELAGRRERSTNQDPWLPSISRGARPSHNGCGKPHPA